MFRLAIRNLLNRKVRSALSISGTMVAIAGMVGLFSVSEGIDSILDDTFGRVPGLVAMSVGSPMPLTSNLPKSWADEAAQVEGVHVVNAEKWERANVINGKVIISPPRLLDGTDLASRSKLRFDLYREAIIAGRYIDDRDIGTGNAVVSESIAEEFGLGVGGTLSINGTYELTVVGIYRTSSIMLDTAILMSLDSMRDMAGDSGSVSTFYIEPEEGIDHEDLAERIMQVFEGRQMRAQASSGRSSLSGLMAMAGLLLQKAHFKLMPLVAEPDSPADSEAQPKTLADAETQADSDEPAKSRPLDVRTANQMAESMTKFTRRMDLFLFIITGIGVLIAVLSIINTMVMSVSERVTEFGILKANGWSRWNVCSLVFWESLLLGVIGGLVGCGVGWVAVEVLNAQFPDRLALLASPSLLLFSLLFSAAMGLVGGLYPAVWAMRLMPMEAIRRG